MSISVAAINAAYKTLGTAAAALKAGVITLEGLGPRPAFPTFIVADADYNDVLATQATWDSSYATTSQANLVLLAAQKAAEDVVNGLLPPNEWVKLTSLTNWGSAVTQWIGRPCKFTNAPNGCSLYSLCATTTQPTTKF